jgi:hypothetical protein
MSDTNQRFHCDNCNKDFSTKGNLTQHIRTNKACLWLREKETTTICNFCNNNIIIKDYEQHVKNCVFKVKIPVLLEENKKLQETISVQTQQIDEIKTQLLLCKTSIKPTRALCLTNDILSPRSFDKVKKIFSDNGIVMYLENINKQPSEFPPMNAGSIYLFWPAQFILSEKKIYKIGKTRQTGNKRLSGYLKGSIRLCEFICEDPDKAEKELLLIFKDKFIPYTGIGGGNEYFEGNWKEMYTEILKYLNMR